MRALHSGNALAFQARVAGSIPAARSTDSARRLTTGEIVVKVARIGSTARGPMGPIPRFFT